MNIRSLTRGDGVVIGAAVLLFIASFLDFYSVDCGAVSDRFCAAVDLPSAWDTDRLGIVLPAVFLTGLIGAGLIVASRAVPSAPKLAGLSLENWGTVLAVAALWSSLWALLVGNADLGAGAVIAFVGNLALAGVAVFGAQVPALKGALLPAPSAQPAQPFGGQPGQQGGYGYPGQPSYGGQQGAPYGGQPGPEQHQAGPAGDPHIGAQHGAPQDQGQGLGQQQAPAAEFAAFWFAVPVARPLFAEDGSQAPIAELAPGTWYLAVDQRGASLVAQTQDGRRGVLQDTSGIQRG
ncbi:hypothetical protein ACIQUQ_06340 [Streptomyces sp. NPDC101118]|uniref:hypothetical protein n=1 Tax=Streptomyces sp. NPDC101118 TaxID=3366109 RepID=UPI0038203857